MTDFLSGPGVRVLVIASTTQHDSVLSSAPVLMQSCRDLSATLVQRCGVRPDALTVLVDPPDAETMALAVSEQARLAESTLVVYFLGNAFVSADRQLYLAAAGTSEPAPGLAEYQALSVGSLWQALRAGRASSVLAVLDCHVSEHSVAELEPANGPYVIASAGPPTLAPNGRHTALTGTFIDLLLHGDPAGPPLLTVDAVYDGLFRAMRAENLPLPRRQTGNAAGNVILASNPAVPVEAAPVQEPAPGDCPYPGLASYGIDDAGLFFGRKQITDRLLAAAAGPTGPSVLVGPSGSGKTSLLRAGFLTALNAGDLPGVPGSASWPRLCLTPGESPLRSLAAVDDLLDGSPGRRLILLVDQLEELFTRCPDPGERLAFVQTITALAAPGEHGPSAVVVLALRADFYGHATAFPELRAALRDGQVLVEPMTDDELRAAIQGPATASGWELEDGLTEAITEELAAEPDSSLLPALSHTLRATWERRVGTRLTFDGYRATGGVAHALATSAEQTYLSLDEPGQNAARRILPRLVQLDDRHPDTARPVELAMLLGTLPDAPAGQRVIDRFTEARLLTLDGDTVRIGHEVLASSWPRLAEWLNADREWRHAKRTLADDADAWERADRDESRLYRGHRLAVMTQRAAESSTGATDLAPGSAAFMDASWRRQRRGAVRRKVVVAVLAVLAVLAPVALIGAVAFHREAVRAEDSDLARQLAAEAETLRAKQPGLAKQLGLLSYRINPAVGRDAMLAGQRIPGQLDSGETVKDVVPDGDAQVLALSTGDGITLRGHGASGRIGDLRIGPIALSADGSLLAAADNADSQAGSGVLRLWTITDPAHPAPRAALPVPATVKSLAVTPDGSTLFAGMATGAILSWDIVDRDAPKPLPALELHTAAVDSLAASPQRGLLASTSVDGRMVLWDIADPTHPAELRHNDVVPVDAGAEFDAGGVPLHRVAFDSTGMFLASPGKAGASAPGTGFPAVWQLKDPLSPRRIPYSSELSDTAVQGNSCFDAMTSVAFSPRTGQVVAVCDKKWNLLKFTTDPDPGSMVPAASSDLPAVAVGAAVFDPTGRQVLQATDTGVDVWDVANPDQPGAKGTVPDVPGTGGQLAYETVGTRQVIAMQGVGETSLWDVSDPAAPTRLAATPAPDLFTGNGVAFSSDGGLLAAPELYGDGQYAGVGLRRTDSQGGQPAGMISDLDNGIGALAFSPTEPILAVSDTNGVVESNHTPNSVRLFDVADPGRPKQIAQLPMDAWAFGFSPDGATLTVSLLENDPTGTQSATWMDLRTYDMTDPAHPKQLWQQRLPSGAHAAFAYSPDGSLLAVFDSTGTLRLWHVDRHQLVGDPAQVTIGDQPGYSPVAFSPDGKRLALIATFANGTESSYRPEMWDVSNADTPVRQYYLPSGQNDSFYALAISPDGQTLAVSRAGAGVDLWDTDPARIVTGICAAVGDPITRSQWDQYLPGRTYQPPCG